MRDLDGAGLAAPQIGVGLRVVIFGMEQSPRYPDEDPVPFTVLVNPQLTALGEELEEGWEGCLSVPGMRGLVPRYRHLRYTGSMPRDTPSTAPPAIFTPGWCSTRSTISMVFLVPAAHSRLPPLRLH